MIDTPFGKFVVDESADPNAVYLINPRYKLVQVGTGEPPRVERVLDLEATAKASFVMNNVGSPIK